MTQQRMAYGPSEQAALAVKDGTLPVQFSNAGIAMETNDREGEDAVSRDSGLIGSGRCNNPEHHQGSETGRPGAGGRRKMIRSVVKLCSCPMTFTRTITSAGHA